MSRREPRNVYSKFALYYDTIYNEIVDYEAQASLLERVFEKFHKGKVSSILDVGCGTGNYTFVFTNRGYQTTGIDLSSDMIEVARKKASRMRKGTSKVPEFFEMDMRDIRLKKSGENKARKFDVVSTLFGGFGYLLDDNDALRFFNSGRAHLNSGGLLIFEFWHVSGIHPQSSSKSGYLSWVKVDDGDRAIIRLDASKYDPQTNLIRVLFDFYILDRKRSELVDSFSETHDLKTYSISEIRNLLERAGLKVEGFFKDSEGSDGGIPNADQSSFRVLAVASNP